DDGGKVACSSSCQGGVPNPFHFMGSAGAIGRRPFPSSSSIYSRREPMKLPRRQFLHLAAGAAALPVVSRIARAQAYPARPVRLMVGFAAGQAIDIVTRMIAQSLSERFGQPFVVENRPGAGGNVATEAVVRAAPDGYTLLAVGSNNMINATLY